jgi:hypothetical protein
MTVSCGSDCKLFYALGNNIKMSLFFKSGFYLRTLIISCIVIQILKKLFYKQERREFYGNKRKED